VKVVDAVEEVVVVEEAEGTEKVEVGVVRATHSREGNAHVALNADFHTKVVAGEEEVVVEAVEEVAIDPLVVVEAEVEHVTLFKEVNAIVEASVDFLTSK
jgi:hypothetical protein